MRATPASARRRDASATSIFALRRPKSNGSHDTSTPTALPHTFVISLVPSTGPEIDGITDCGSSSPNTLLRVARFNCPSPSNRGRYAVRARLIPAAAAATCSAETRTEG